MKARITRSGGVAGIPQTREVQLTPEQLAKLREHCGDRLQPVPDAFTYEVQVGGETFNVSDELLDTLLR